MKRISFVLIVAILMTACNNSGGSWSTADTQKFMTTCLQNAMNTGADEQTSKAHCNCTLAKIQKKYSSYTEADTKMTRDEVSAIEQQCIQEMQNRGNNDDKKGGLLGGSGWSNADKQKFLNTCVNNAINSGADQQISNQHCQCVLEKIQKKYSSYAEADRKMTKTEVDALEQECIEERNKTNGDDNNQ